MHIFNHDHERVLAISHAYFPMTIFISNDSHMILHLLNLNENWIVNFISSTEIGTMSLDIEIVMGGGGDMHDLCTKHVHGHG